jgi:uncharacterized protein YpmS
MRFQAKPTILIALTVLVLASLSCNLPGKSKAPEPTPIPVSTESIEELEQEIEDAVATAQSGGPVELTFTEQQLTSLAAAQLESQPDTPVKDIQVSLRNGQVEITGTAERSGLDLPFSVTLTISVDAQGTPRSSIVDASVGPLPVPQSILDQVTAQLDQVIASQYASNTHNMVVESITIYDGYMTIKGHTR